MNRKLLTPKPKRLLNLLNYICTHTLMLAAFFMVIWMDGIKKRKRSNVVHEIAALWTKLIIKIYTNVNTNKCNEIVNNNENSDM